MPATTAIRARTIAHLSRNMVFSFSLRGNKQFSSCKGRTRRASVREPACRGLTLRVEPAPKTRLGESGHGGGAPRRIFGLGVGVPGLKRKAFLPHPSYP